MVALKSLIRNEAGVPVTGWKVRVRAAVAHLSLSVLIAALAFCLVYFVWYPGPFWRMSGGRDLFFLVMSVDVCLGPLITLAIFNPAKGLGKLAFDLVIIGLVQLSALGYGVWTVSQARPLFAVFNVDRITVVTGSDLTSADLAVAERPEFRSAPWLGPALIGTRRATDPAEKLAMIDAALSGKDVAVSPKYYVPYAETRDEVLRRAEPLEKLYAKNASRKDDIDARIARLGKPATDFGFLPVVARQDWVAVISRTTGEVLDYWPLSGF